MKKLCLSLLIFFCAHYSFANSPGDSTLNDTTKKTTEKSIKKADSLKPSVSDSAAIKNLAGKIDSLKTLINLKDTGRNTNCSCQPHYKKEGLNVGEWLMVASPFLLLSLVILIVSVRLKNFIINDALTENEQPRQTVKNTEYTVDNLVKIKDTPNLSVLIPPTIEVSVEGTTNRPSISRYIAFITSMIIIILVVCMSSFFIYHYISTGCPPEFGALTTMLIALGLGVTPYITNKIATASVANKS